MKQTSANLRKTADLAGSGSMHYNRPVPGHNRRAKYLTIFFSLHIFAAHCLAAQQASWMAGRSNPEDLLIQLATIGPGDELYSWWGHSALMITDTRSGESRFYNYGLFSFEQTDFFTNFAMGRLWFMVGAGRTMRELESYKARNRRITIQTLNVSREKKLWVSRFVETNILPENREYLYDHYNDNCATRVRDILDVVSDGKLSSVTDVPANTTFREITRRFSGGYFLTDTLLMFLMGRSIDTPITVWQTMFLPTELRDAIDGLEVENEEGELVRFVTKKEVWYEPVGRPPVPEKSPSPIPLSLGLGGGAGVLILAGSLLLRNRKSAERICFGVASSIVALIAGLPGLVLAFMSLFTNHTVTYWNENLFLANPLTFVALPLGFLSVAGIRGTARITAWLWVILAGIGLLYIVLKPLPFLAQDNWQIVALLMPPFAALAFAGRNLLRRG